MANLYLAKGSAKSLHHMIVYQSQTIYPLWNNIADAVRWVFPGSWALRDVPPPQEPCEGGVSVVLCSVSVQGGEEPERKDLRHPGRGGLPGHLQVGVCALWVQTSRVASPVCVFLTIIQI